MSIINRLLPRLVMIAELRDLRMKALIAVCNDPSNDAIRDIKFTALTYNLAKYWFQPKAKY